MSDRIAAERMQVQEVEEIPDLSSQSGAPRFSVGQTFTALKYPNYRLWFFGQMVSMFGTWMQTTAQGFLVFELTHSPEYLGYVGFASGIPSWLFMLYAGVVADRMPRRTLMIITQTVMMLLAGVLAFLTFAQLVAPWHIIVLAFLLGIANAFDAPARQSFTLEMVEREDLTNAIALNSTMFNTATAVGPAAAGITYALVGPALCFTLNAFSFLAVIAALIMMKLKPLPILPRTKSGLHEMCEGIRYVGSHGTIRLIILMVATTSVFAFSFATLLPAWAVNVLGGDSTTNGYMQSARGFGSLLAALMIASLGRFRYRGKLMVVGLFVFPLLLFVFAFVRSIPLSLLVLIGIGWSTILFFNLANSLVQTLVKDDLRGRVMGVYSLTFFGLIPIGALFSGALAQRIGEPLTIVVGAAVSLAVTIGATLLTPKLRGLE